MYIIFMFKKHHINSYAFYLIISSNISFACDQVSKSLELELS